MYFQSKTFFFLSNHSWSILVVLVCLYIFFIVFFQFLHHEIANQLYLVCMAYDLASHWITWHNRRNHGLKIKSCWCFFSVSEKTAFRVGSTSIILIYLFHFGREIIIEILLVSMILKHASKMSCDKITKISFF